MPQSRDEPRHFLDSDSLVLAVALSLQSEVDHYGGRTVSDPQQSDRITSAIAIGTRHFQGTNVSQVQTSNTACEFLESETVRGVASKDLTEQLVLMFIG